MQQDKASIHGDAARIIGVSDLEEACKAAVNLYEDGIDCIELCGAFGEEGAKRVIHATHNKIPVGFITHLPEQDELYETVFSNRKLK